MSRLGASTNPIRTNQWDMGDIEERSDLSDNDDDKMSDVRLDIQVGQADSFKLMQQHQSNGNNDCFSDSYNRILSESGNTNNSNHVIGGGLLGFGGTASGKANSLMGMQLTPNSLMQMQLTPIGQKEGSKESPIFSTSFGTFGNQFGRNGKDKRSLAQQMVLSASQQSEELALFN